MHAPDSCFDLEKNAARRPRGWKSRFLRQGTSKIVDKVNELSNFPSSALLSSNRCILSPLIRSLTGAKQYTKTHSEIVDSGAGGYFFIKDAHKNNLYPTAPLIRVGTALGQPMTSASTCDISIPRIPSDFPTTVHVMSGL